MVVDAHARAGGSTSTHRQPCDCKGCRSLAASFAGATRYFRRASVTATSLKVCPLPTHRCREFTRSHVLEHLSHADFWTALHNTFRMLKPGGIFRLVVPDPQARAERYLLDTGLNRPEANSWFMRATRLGRERRSHGLGPLLREAFGRSAHLWMWDENSLAAALHKAGFIGIRRCRFGDCADAAFRQVEEAERVHDSRAGIEECAMEAVRPDRGKSC
jgi:hypothetical protein